MEYGIFGEGSQILTNQNRDFPKAKIPYSIDLVLVVKFNVLCTLLNLQTPTFLVVLF